jgi:protein-S-isoprenylcysteine O-methyltransferase Ste14
MPLVRHPICSGLFFAFLGWGLLVQGWLTIGYALLLANRYKGAP